MQQAFECNFYRYEDKLGETGLGPSFKYRYITNTTSSQNITNDNHKINTIIKRTLSGFKLTDVSEGNTTPVVFPLEAKM